MNRPSPFRSAAKAWLAAAALTLPLLTALAVPVQAQGTDAGDGWRIGVSVGGISTVGLVFEVYRDSRSIDVTLGTFGFRDLGLAVSANIGTRIQEGLQSALADVDGLIEVRGQGLMIGIQLDRPCAGLVGTALKQGLLINVTADSVVRLLPPLVISEQQADRLVSNLSSLVRDFLAGQ